MILRIQRRIRSYSSRGAIEVVLVIIGVDVYMLLFMVLQQNTGGYPEMVGGGFGSGISRGGIKKGGRQFFW